MESGKNSMSPHERSLAVVTTDQRHIQILFLWLLGIDQKGRNWPHAAAVSMNTRWISGRALLLFTYFHLIPQRILFSLQDCKVLGILILWCVSVEVYNLKAYLTDINRPNESSCWQNDCEKSFYYAVARRQSWVSLLVCMC